MAPPLRTRVNTFAPTNGREPSIPPTEISDEVVYTPQSSSLSPVSRDSSVNRSNPFIILQSRLKSPGTAMSRIMNSTVNEADDVIVINGIQYIKTAAIGELKTMALEHLLPENARHMLDTTPFSYQKIEVDLAEEISRLLGQRDGNKQMQFQGNFHQLSPSPEVNCGLYKPFWDNLPGFFRNALVKIVAKAGVSIRAYYVHMPIAMKLFGHKDFTQYRSDAVAGIGIDLEFGVRLPHLDILIGLFYASPYRTTDIKDMQCLLPKDSASDLFNLYLAASCFKLEDVKDLVVSCMLDCRMHDLLVNAQIVYDTKFLDDKFRGYFKNTFVRLLHDTVHEIVKDVTLSGDREPFLSYKNAISTKCAAGGRLAQDIVDSLVKDIAYTFADVSGWTEFNRSLVDDCHTSETSIHSNKSNADARSQSEHVSCGNEDPQHSGWTLPDLNQNIWDAWGPEKENTNAVSAVQDNISKNPTGLTTAAVNSWNAQNDNDQTTAQKWKGNQDNNVQATTQDYKGIPRDNAQSTAQTLGNTLNENGQTSAHGWNTAWTPLMNDDIPQAPPAAHLPEEAGAHHNVPNLDPLPTPAKPVLASAPLYTYGPRLDSWTAYANAPARYFGTTAIAVRDSNVHNCTLPFKTGDTIKDVFIVATPFGRPTRMSGVCHGLRGTFPYSFVSMLAARPTPTADTPLFVNVDHDDDSNAAY